MRLTSWIKRLTASIEDVLALIGCKEIGGRWSPCPAGCEQSKNDRRGRVNIEARRKGARKDQPIWICSSCSEKGDAADVVAWTVATKSASVLSDEEHASCEAWCAARGLLSGDTTSRLTPRAPRYTTPAAMCPYEPTESELAYEEALAILGRKKGEKLNEDEAAAMLGRCCSNPFGFCGRTVAIEYQPLPEARGIKQPSKWRDCGRERRMMQWAEFAELVSRRARCVATKGRYPFGFHTLRDETADLEDNNVSSVTQLVFDCDGRGGWSRVLKIMRASGLSFVLAATSSYQNEKEPKSWHLHIPIDGGFKIDPDDIDGCKRRWRLLCAKIVGWLSGVLRLDANDLERRANCRHDPGLDPTLYRQLCRQIYLGTQRDETIHALPVEWHKGASLNLDALDQAIKLKSEHVDRAAARLAAWPSARVLRDIERALEFYKEPRLGECSSAYRVAGELPRNLSTINRAKAYLPLVDKDSVWRSFVGYDEEDFDFPEHPSARLYLDFGSKQIPTSDILRREHENIT